MRQQVYHMISQYHLDLDEQLKAAVAEALDPKRVQLILNETAKQEVTKLVREQTEAFFRYGAGYKAVSESIEKMLTKKMVAKKKTK